MDPGRKYIDALIVRDEHEKKPFCLIFDEFKKYNRDITKLKDKNNELIIIEAPK
jgi:hypothetical protein